MTDFDILVIGAGIAGASVAAHLSETRSVVLLEAEARAGSHSTGRSIAQFSEIYGGDLVRALTRASREFFYAPPAGFADIALVKKRGSLYIATAGQRDSLERFAAIPDIAAATTRLSTAELKAACPILNADVTDGVLEHDAADIEVDALLQGYLRQFRNRGGRLLTEHAVSSLSHQNGRWTAIAGGQRFTAPIVVNAAGAWADHVAALAGVAAIGLRPKRRTALLVDPPAGMAIEDWPLVSDIDEQFYFKPDAGLLMLSPVDETPSEPCDVQPDELDIAVAVDRVETVTSLQVRRVKHRWAGLRSFVADRLPVAGFDGHAPGFFWLAGQGGYGIQTAPALSQAAAALVTASPIPGRLAAMGIDAARLSPARLDLQAA